MSVFLKLCEFMLPLDWRMKHLPCQLSIVRLFPGNSWQPSPALEYLTYLAPLARQPLPGQEHQQVSAILKKKEKILLATPSAFIMWHIWKYATYLAPLQGALALGNPSLARNTSRSLQFWSKKEKNHIENAFCFYYVAYLEFLQSNKILPLQSFL